MTKKFVSEIADHSTNETDEIITRGNENTAVFSLDANFDMIAVSVV